jgi:hypothetical protein
MRTLVSTSSSLIAHPRDVGDDDRSRLADARERDDSPRQIKSGHAWIWVRLIGVAFLFKVFESVYQLALQIATISNLMTVASVVGAEPNQQAYRLWIGVVLLAAQIAVFALLTFYFLRKGKAVHKLLMFERRGQAAAN